ncbi:hypothetical protein DVQ95_02920 [Yersinia enterocolitica]|nr:hypothetical protein [Yersinia enterocolitica]EKN5983532.1 hypothetical protein [Yersinia enterocolitica]EKN5988550.1 hypothetical protein [Yersinia enterocolitica]
MESQVGSKRTHPDELTQVSDSGSRAKLTPLRLQERRIIRSSSRRRYIHHLRRDYPDARLYLPY